MTPLERHRRSIRTSTRTRWRVIGVGFGCAAGLLIIVKALFALPYGLRAFMAFDLADVAFSHCMMGLGFSMAIYAGLLEDRFQFLFASDAERVEVLADRRER